MDAARDRRARFEHLWEAHYDAIHAYVLRRDAELADEVAADVFATAWRRLDAIDVETARPWLYGVARRTLSNAGRSSRRRGELVRRLAGEAAVGASATPGDDASESGQRLTRQLARLSDRDRETLRLVAWEGLDGRALADALGCSVPAARVRLHRARTRLKKLLATDPGPGGRTVAELRHLEEA